MTDLASLSDKELDAHIEATALDAPTANTLTGPTLSLKIGAFAKDIPLQSLSPAMQDRVAAIRAENPRMTQQDAIMAELQANSRDMLVVNGVGDGANAYQRELFTIHREADDIERDISGIKKRLEEISRYDPTTGAPIYRLTGDARRNVEIELRSQEKRLELRLTVESEQRLAKAREQTRADIRAAAEMKEDLAEIERRVATNTREDRINQAVEAKTRMRRNTI